MRPKPERLGPERWRPVKLIVETPTTYLEERRYILDVMLGEFLGLEFHHRPADRVGVRIRLPGSAPEKELRVADVLFRVPSAGWLTRDALPERPLPRWSSPPSFGAPAEGELPVLYGAPLTGDSFHEVGEDEIRLGVDVFGGAFFMLTRYEELIEPERDRFDRFPATASIAGREGFLDRPIVNEYLELLWWALKRLWPSLERKAREPRVFLSHDVDKPWRVLGSPAWLTLLGVASDVFRHGDPSTAVRRLRSYPAVRSGRPEGDLHYTFDFIMDLSEACGLRSAFYFLCGRTAGKLDGNYDPDDPRIRDLLRHIHRRGHEIGLHPSFGTFRDGEQTRREFETLRRVCGEESISPASWGGRQHYLRWENPTTWQIWEDIGLAYDSTLAFADRAGFRCGVCYEYPVFNLRTRRRLRLRERPLIVMEVSLLQYMKLSVPQASAVLFGLRDRCHRYAGDFTLLWHNSSLFAERQKAWYRSILERITS